ncbi:hypothetical protein AGMMS50268_28540 [Spirochaetia bacterium]|nr:hypothetical protein AGMMS50268_28540 [Spirochaetia bacterium]
MGILAALGVFSALSLNLLLQFGLGLRGFSPDRELPAKLPPEGRDPAPGPGPAVPWYETAAIFLSVIFLWLFFTLILAPMKLGFFWYFLLFPLGAPACIAAEWLLVRLVRIVTTQVLPKLAKSVFSDEEKAQDIHLDVKRSVPLFQGISAYDGLVPLALLLTLNLAFTFMEAVILSLGFALGFLFSILILNEIRRRSALEAVPLFLRGLPLTLISMGLLSLIFSSGALIFLNVLMF